MNAMYVSGHVRVRTCTCPDMYVSGHAGLLPSAGKCAQFAFTVATLHRNGDELDEFIDSFYCCPWSCCSANLDVP